MGSVLSPGEPDGSQGVPVTPDADPPAAEQACTAEPGTRAPAADPARWRRRRRRILAWGSASLAVLIVAVLVAGIALLRHFNANIQQDDIRGLLGTQPVKLHPQAENILVIGSDTRSGQGKGYGSGFVTDQSDTLMIIHIPADRKWAEVMSIPRDSWVNIPSCEMGNGRRSAPTQFKINETFAIANLGGNQTALGYVRARYSLGDGSDLERIGRQQAFMSSLVSRVKSQLLNPLAIYRFLDAATRSLTVDSQPGGITGLYDLGQSLRDVPQDKIAFFTVPNFPRGQVVPGDTANVLWTQPDANQIFASFRDDVPAGNSLFAAQPARQPGTAAGLSVAAPRASASHAASPGIAPRATVSSAASASASPGTIRAGTANQNICAG